MNDRPPWSKVNEFTSRRQSSAVTQEKVKKMTNHPHRWQDTASDSTETQPVSERSRLLEIIGVLSAVGFFLGVFLAWRTQMGGLVTQRQFDQLAEGQTLEDVEKILGKADRAEPEKLEFGVRSQVLIWENSSDSRIACTFEENRLRSRNAKNLP